MLIGAIRMKNESWILRYTLSAMSEIVDKIVIVDDGSVDNSVEIAKTFEKVKRIHLNHPKNENDIDEPRDWNKLTEMAGELNATWILYTDADEMIEPSIKGHIDLMLNQNAIDVYKFRKISPWLGFDKYRVDSNRYNHSAVEVLNPILVRYSNKLKWTNNRGGLIKMLIKKAIRGESFKPNYGRAFPLGISGGVECRDDIVSIHANYIDFDRLLRKQVFYALRETKIRPDKTRQEIIDWVSRGWDTKKARFEPVNKQWLWVQYLKYIEIQSSVNELFENDH